jgi:hypothetical protein
VKLQARLRLVFGLVLLAVLVWLPFEDIQLAWSLLLAAAISAVLAAYWSSRASFAPLVMPVLGALLGALAPLIASILLLVKTGLHGHPSPDFTWENFLSLLQSLPAWIFGGLLLGVGAALQQAALDRTRR